MLSSNTNTNNSSSQDLFNTFALSEMLGVSLPTQYSETEKEQIHRSAYILTRSRFADRRAIKLSIGRFVGDFMTFFEEKVKRHSPLKMAIFSVHDNTRISLSLLLSSLLIDLSKNISISITFFVLFL